MKKDITGQKFNYLTAIRKIENEKRNKWLFKCDCGKEKIIRLETVEQGQKSCGCKRGLDLNGKKFGKLTVIKRVYDNMSPKSGRWLCKCDCGEEKVFNATHLNSRLVESCGCIIWRGYKDIYGTFWCHIKHSARLRKIKFDLTIEQIWDLFVKQDKKCALTGLPINFASKCDSLDGTASLDRVDSDKGYTIDNIQWVHKIINYMKQDYVQDEFIKYCVLVANFSQQTKPNLDVLTV